ncbi:hypothetical protein D3C74_246300 [compost metagenome]
MLAPKIRVHGNARDLYLVRSHAALDEQCLDFGRGDEILVNSGTHPGAVGIIVCDQRAKRHVQACGQLKVGNDGARDRMRANDQVGLKLRDDVGCVLIEHFVQSQTGKPAYRFLVLVFIK